MKTIEELESENSFLRNDFSQVMKIEKDVMQILEFHGLPFRMLPGYATRLMATLDVIRAADPAAEAENKALIEELTELRAFRRGVLALTR